jgi:hypothetical protein
MAWEHRQRYQGRGVAGEIAIKSIGTTGTKYVEAVIECTVGPNVGQRVRWKGYVNNEKNVEATVAELRAMGWRGKRLGDWSGFGSTEIEFQCLVEEGQKPDASGRLPRYFKAAFVRPRTRVNDKARASLKEVDDVNAEFGHLLGGEGVAGPVPLDASDAAEDDIPFGASAPSFP